MKDWTFMHLTHFLSIYFYVQTMACEKTFENMSNEANR